MYKFLIDPITKVADTACIYRIADRVTIPRNIDNRDYLEYLAWVAAGNAPLPA